MSRTDRMKPLAAALSGTEETCPLPASHDRTLECHYFIHKLANSYHEPDEFRYYLHAFVQACCSAVGMLFIETQTQEQFRDFRKDLKSFASSDEYRRLKRIRDIALHKQSLLADSFASIGLFRYRRLKLAFGGKVNPALSSLQLIGPVRNDILFVSPHRMACGEEIGIEREWRLREVGDVELVEFCGRRFEDVSKLLAQAHGAAKSNFSGAGCSLLSNGFRILVESDIFPEVNGGV